MEKADATRESARDGMVGFGQRLGGGPSKGVSIEVCAGVAGLRELSARARAGRGLSGTLGGLFLVEVARRGVVQLTSGKGEEGLRRFG
jgi:hypothetical protein